jgi:citrate synthase
MGGIEYQNPDKYKDYWKTGVSELKRNEIYLRGYPLEEISGRVPYVDAIILLLRGELPDEVESKVVNAIFTSAMDHQFLNATALAARVVVSAHPNPVVGIAAGVLSFGQVTAGVPGYVVEMLNEYFPEDESRESIEAAGKRLVDDFRGRRDRIWGFGHPLHDMLGPHYTFRSQLLRDRIEEAGLNVSRYVALYEAAHTEFLRQVGRPMPINVDGVMGAAFAELGYTPTQAFALAPFTMLPGIVAHAVEEIEEGVPLRIVPESEYVGPAPRSRFGVDVAEYTSEAKLAKSGPEMPS